MAEQNAMSIKRYITPAKPIVIKYTSCNFITACYKFSL